MPLKMKGCAMTFTLLSAAFAQIRTPGGCRPGGCQG